MSRPPGSLHSLNRLRAIEVNRLYLAEERFPS